MAKNEDDCIRWDVDGALGRLWASMSGNPVCHLCEEAPGEVYKKSHKRKNGITLEDSVMYCRSCVDNRSEDVSEDFKQWWADRWAKSEAVAEKNWQEHGVYTNVSSKDGPSKDFGYVKLENGTFRPYRHVHPKDGRDEVERDVSDERERIDKLEVSEEEKFSIYMDFLNAYKPSDEKGEMYLKRQIESVKRHLRGEPS